MEVTNVTEEPFKGKKEDRDSMKWNTNDIEKFLTAHRPFEILYNIRHKDYLDKGKKCDAWGRLMSQLKKQGLHITTEEALKKKVKSLKDVFRKELHKVLNSKRSGSSTSQLYTPKLSWFQSANFLQPYLEKRDSTSNLEIEFLELQNGHSEDSAYSPSTRTTTTTSISGATSTTASEDESFNFKAPVKRCRKKSEASETTTDPIIKDAMEQLSKLEKHINQRDDCDTFGEYIATELRKLTPIQRAILKRDISNQLHEAIIQNLVANDPSIQLVQMQE